MSDQVPVAPEWLSVEQRGRDVVLRWTPSFDAAFFSYEVFLMDGEKPGARITPDPLRAALWIDTAPPAGRRRYGVRAVSASGLASDVVISEETTVREP